MGTCPRIDEQTSDAIRGWGRPQRLGSVTLPHRSRALFGIRGRTLPHERQTQLEFPRLTRSAGSKARNRLDSIEDLPKA
jgi:hypothetical protein